MMGKRGKKIPWKPLPIPKVEDANCVPDNLCTVLEIHNPDPDKDAPKHLENCSVQEADFPSLGKGNLGEQIQETNVLAQVNADPYLSSASNKIQKSNSLWNSHSLDFSGPHLSNNNKSWLNKSTKKQDERLGAHKKGVDDKLRKSTRQLPTTSAIEEDMNMVKIDSPAAVGFEVDDCTPP